MDEATDRRRHPRYLLPSMYTSVDVRPLSSDEYQWSGHAYDISLGGLRFELDHPIEPGTRVAIRIELPGAERLRRLLGMEVEPEAIQDVMERLGMVVEARGEFFVQHDRLVPLR